MKEPYGITVFCDDIRDEVSNKKTYVGVYGTDMIVDGTFPILIPTFGIAVRYLEPLDMPVEPVSIKMFVPSDSPDGSDVLIDVDLSADRPQYPPQNHGDALAEFRAHILNFRVSPMVIKSEGHIKVRAYIGEREVRLGSLRIRRMENMAN